MGREDVMNATAYSPYREQRALPDGLTVLELVDNAWFDWVAWQHCFFAGTTVACAGATR